MNANDVIESYVNDVAMQLPRKQRNDVAFELRALLNEELQGKADDAGRAPDADMATGLLNAFGHPAEVAARYRPTLTIIDPSDGYRFLRATIIGLLIIWSLGLISSLQQTTDFLGVLGQWWTQVVIPSLWWPGLLVTGFGISAWVGRRWPKTSSWKPRAADRIQGTRAALMLAVFGIFCGLFVLMEPRWILDFIWGGRAAPVAYEALTYTDSFLQRQAPWLFLLLAANIPLLATVIVQGRWSTRMRSIEAGLGFLTLAAMIWTILDGPILKTALSDQTCKMLMLLIVASTLIHYAFKFYQRVRPQPN